MKVNLFKRTAIVLTSKGIKFKNSYYLPDMSYGQFLIYDQFKPVYYVDLFDNSCKLIRDYIDAHKIDAETVINQLLALNKLRHLSLREQCLLKLRFGKETSEQYELERYEITNSDFDKIYINLNYIYPDYT